MVLSSPKSRDYSEIMSTRFKIAHSELVCNEVLSLVGTLSTVVAR
jgi:hypothetical protein